MIVLGVTHTPVVGGGLGALNWGMAPFQAGCFYPETWSALNTLEPGKAEKSGYRTPRGSTPVGPAESCIQSMKPVEAS